jgi:hypothetical protein
MVTMAMMLLLAVSLLLALAFTRTYSNQNYFNPSTNNISRLYGIGSMQIELPPHWQRVPSPQGTPRPSGISRQFINTLRPDEQLYISLLSLPAITSPPQVLAMVKQRMSLHPNHPVSFTTTIRHGHRTMLITSLQDGNDLEAGVLLHHIAIFTDTGRQHGVTIFTQRFSKRDLHRPESQFDIEPISLITDIAQQAVFRELQPASAQALQDAGLSNLPEEQSKNWSLATTLDGGEHQSVLLMPRSGPQSFWTARVRSGPLLTLPAQAPDAAALNPGQLLMQTVFGGDDERPALMSEPELLQADSHRIWRWQYPASPSDPHHYRERWYVVQSHDTLASAPAGLVIDLICLPDNREQVSKHLIAQALTLLQPASRPRSTSAESETQQALERGQAIARILNRDLQSRIPHISEYSLFNMGRYSLGLLLAQSGPAANSDILRGRSLLIQSETPRYVYEQRWVISPQADHWWLTGRMSLHREDADAPQPDSHERLEFHQGTLRALDLMNKAATESVSWTIKPPAPFVSSLAMDYFPPASLEAWADEPAALLWTHLGLRKIQAVFFEVRRATQANAPAPWQVIIRPPAAIEPIVLWVDAQGQTIQSQWHMQEEIGAMSWPYSLQQIPREQAIQRFKAIESDIHNWEKEWETP